MGFFFIILLWVSDLMSRRTVVGTAHALKVIFSFLRWLNSLQTCDIIAWHLIFYNFFCFWVVFVYIWVSLNIFFSLQQIKAFDFKKLFRVFSSFRLFSWGSHHSGLFHVFHNIIWLGTHWLMTHLDIIRLMSWLRLHWSIIFFYDLRLFLLILSLKRVNIWKGRTWKTCQFWGWRKARNFHSGRRTHDTFKRRTCFFSLGRHASRKIVIHRLIFVSIKLLSRRLHIRRVWLKNIRSNFSIYRGWFSELKIRETQRLISLRKCIVLYDFWSRRSETLDYWSWKQIFCRLIIDVSILEHSYFLYRCSSHRKSIIYTSSIMNHIDSDSIIVNHIRFNWQLYRILKLFFIFFNRYNDLTDL